MSTHWTDRRTAVAMVGAELARRGWKLYGWKEDRSDSMTDYYDPERWDGLAVKGDAVVVVADSQASDGHQPVKSACDVVGACERCGGSGDDPDGWTYAKAKEDPRGWHRESLDPGCVAMLPDVVSPIAFRDYGPELCRKCHGGGKVFGNFRTEPEGERWPAHQGNPAGRLWHVERGGRIVASGVGVFAVASERYDGKHYVVHPDGTPLTAPPEHWDEGRCRDCGKAGAAGELRREDCPEARPKLRALCDRIEAACADKPRPHTVAEHTIRATPERVTVRPSEVKPGNVEVLFPAKPDDITRARLKQAGFRWYGLGGLWYGRADALPAGIG